MVVMVVKDTMYIAFMDKLLIFMLNFFLFVQYYFFVLKIFNLNVYEFEFVCKTYIFCFEAGR